MKIDQARLEEHQRLAEIWEAAVRASHFFLTEEDIFHYRPLVREALAQAPVWVARDEQGQAWGFMGLIPPEGSKPAQVPMLFIDPARHGLGLGRALIEEAARRHGALELEVNEQNPGAARFYEKMGFQITGRSELDSEGRPFPLLHLRREG